MFIIFANYSERTPFWEGSALAEKLWTAKTIKTLFQKLISKNFLSFILVQCTFLLFHNHTNVMNNTESQPEQNTNQDKNIVFSSAEADEFGTLIENKVEKINISFLKNPGVYEILDVQNNCSYYGESDCLLSRLQIHLRQLRNGTHFCKKLLEVYQKTGEDNFQFFVIVSGPEWASGKKRRDYQNQLIEENSSRCYNQTKSQCLNSPSTLIRPLMYKGKRYNAVRQSVVDKNHVKISRTTLIRQLADPAITDVYYLNEDPILHGSIPIFAKQNDGPEVFFPSIRAAV